MKLLSSIGSSLRDENGLRRWLPAGFRLLALALGALQTWAAVQSMSMNEDGISYLDIGDAYMRGDWEAAINPVWSPMYSWILGPVMHVVEPSMSWEFPVVQIVNFFIYLAALVCFEFFWRQVMRYHKSMAEESAGEHFIPLPDWAGWALGYILFIFSSLNLIQIWAVTPDMLMAAFVYLAAGVLVRIRLQGPGWRNYMLFGGLLGLSYLAKAVMFPVAFIFLAVSLFAFGKPRHALPYASAALAVFLLVSAPFIALVSINRGAFKFGDAGKLTYIRYLNDIPYPHWQGEPPGSGTPKHPTRKIFDDPPIYEFGAPIGGTYPVSYDPSYWYEGAVYRFNLKKQVGYVLYSLKYYLDLFFRQQAALALGLLLLYWNSRWRPMHIPAFLSRWGLVFPAVAAFGFYGLVNVIGRYIGVFVLLFWADLLANVRLPDTSSSRRLVSSLSIIMIMFMLISIGLFNLEKFLEFTGQATPHQRVVRQASPPSWPGEVAQELHRLGVEPGDHVAVIGYAFTSFWARLAKVKIVAEMFGHDADPFWLGDASFRARVMDAFAGAGARAVVAERVPDYATTTRWHQVGRSNYFIYVIDS